MQLNCTHHGHFEGTSPFALCPACIRTQAQAITAMAEKQSECISTPQAKSDREPFDLTQIPYEAEKRLGAIFKEGEVKYGRMNWRQGVGDKGYQLERANHALKHLRIYVHLLETGEYLGKDDEDDLAKVAWFCCTQMELERLEALEERYEPRSTES